MCREILYLERIRVIIIILRLCLQYKQNKNKCIKINFKSMINHHCEVHSHLSN